MFTTLETPDPVRLNSFSAGDTSVMPPRRPMPFANSMSAAFMSVLTRLENSCTLSPAIFAIFSVSEPIFCITFESAVAATSALSPCVSNIAPSPITCACVRPAVFAIAERRVVKSRILPSDALLFCASSLIADAVESIACFNPIRLSSPNMLASFPIFFTAPSPRSSPSAMLIWSAACTKSSTSFLPVMPRRPASAARSLRAARPVRVSIFLNSSLSSSTSFAAMPVYFDTPATCSCISANLDT